MALFNCKDCGGKVSTAARFCPHCGRIVSLDNNVKIIRFELFYQIWNADNFQVCLK